jgi:Ca-activated chloride channel homolog
MNKKQNSSLVYFFIFFGLIVFYNSDFSSDKNVPSKKVERKVQGTSGNTLTWPPKEAESVSPLPLEEQTDVNYYVIFDGSGSMLESSCTNNSNRIRVARDAMRHFVNHVPDSARLGLYVFDNRGVTERVPLGKENRNELIQAIESVNPGSVTPLRKSISDAVISLGKQYAAQLGYGEYHLVIVTDGIASKGQDPSGVVKWILENTPIVIHTIGFCIDENHSLNIPGNTIYRSANSPEELTASLEAVLAEAEVFDISKFTDDQ